jgi:hypothetical protein
VCVRASAPGFTSFACCAPRDAEEEDDAWASAPAPDALGRHLESAGADAGAFADVGAAAAAAKKTDRLVSGDGAEDLA